MPSVATWMDLEIVMLSEVRKGKILYYIPYMWNLKRNGTNELIYKIDLENKLMVAGGKDSGKDRWKGQGVWDGHVHTTIFTMDNQQGPTVQHIEPWSMLCDKMGGEIWGRMDTGICIAESLCCPPENITTLLTYYTPI